MTAITDGPQEFVFDRFQFYRKNAENVHDSAASVSPKLDRGRGCESGRFERRSREPITRRRTAVEP